MRLTPAAFLAIFAICAIAEPVLWGQRQRKDPTRDPRAGGWIDFGQLELKSNGKDWMVATIQMTPMLKPTREKIPTTRDKLGNPPRPPVPTLVRRPNRAPAGALNYFEEVKIDLYLCFKNIRRLLELKEDNDGQEPPLDEYLNYYHAQVEFLTLEADGRPRMLQFFLPLSIAKRDYFDDLRDVNKPYFGHYVDISIGNASMFDELMEEAKIKGRRQPSQLPIYFDWLRTKGASLTESQKLDVLRSFKQKAIGNSGLTEGILLPAHLLGAGSRSGVKFPKPTD